MPDRHSLSEKEKIRLFELSKIEKKYIDLGKNAIAGMDEVGRGPLAGPVVAACVMLKPNEYFYQYINDSKKVTAKRRKVLFEKIMNNSLSIGIGIVSQERIDEINILNATKEAMLEAYNRMPIKPEVLLIDHVSLDGIDVIKESITKGDMLSVSIAAASIIAKETRDEIMRKEAIDYPLYGFESNVGYGTKQHIDGIKKYGLCPLHRKSFTKKWR